MPVSSCRRCGLKLDVGRLMGLHPNVRVDGVLRVHWPAPGGDDEAEHIASRLLRYLGRRYWPERVYQEPEDIMQESMVSLAGYLASHSNEPLDTAGRLRLGYLIAGRRHTDLLRRVHTKVTEPVAHYDNVNLDAAGFGELQEAVSQLSSSDQEVVSLRIMMDLSVAEIATVLGITPNTARVRLHRAKLRLRRMVL